MLGVGAGIVVASVALLKNDPPPPDAAAGRPADGAAISRESAWDAAVGADFAVPRRNPAVPAPDLPGRSSLTHLELVPNVTGGRDAGFTIRTMAETGPLAEAGLRAGDVLTTIDGLPLDADRARRLAEEFGGLDDVEIAYRRGSEFRETLVVFRAR